MKKSREILKVIGRSIKRMVGYLMRFVYPVKSTKILFIPYAGSYEYDHASLENYKSDNVLILIRYILDQKEYQDKEIVIVTGKDRLQSEKEYCSINYPNANIKFIENYSSPYLKTGIRFQKEATTSKLIISAEDRFDPKFGLPKKRLTQKYVCIGYYPVSMKNDYQTEKQLGKSAHYTDMFASTSLINTQIECASLTTEMDKFYPIGKCRTDVLLEEQDVSSIREFLMKQCKYQVRRILLYVPTHRDYERGNISGSRFILGFDVNTSAFTKYLEDNQILIVCKLHSGQNESAISASIPNGVIFFHGDERFGLTELMKASDMLMTDYTSAYVDYLLLNKPILFNFYDIEKYSKVRGLAFYPYEKFCAGLPFKDEQSFYRVMDETLRNPNLHQKERMEMLEYFQTYRTNVRENTYNVIFGEEGIINQ